MLGPLHKNEHFFEGWGATHPTPLKNEISTLPTKSQTFYTIIIFSDRTEGFALFLGLWAAFLRHLTTRNTFFSLCLWQQNGVFFLRIVRIAHSL